MEAVSLPWAQALQVRMQNGLERRFDNPHDAADFLEHEWPVKHGGEYELALRTCYHALQKEVPLLAAREAFLAACLEAKLEVVARSTRH
jgi:hypothetical protein